MTAEEAGYIILDIFHRECAKAGESLSNKDLHGAYFRKTESTLGFFEGVAYLTERKWLTPTKDAVNSNQITKAGWNTAV